MKMLKENILDCVRLGVVLAGLVALATPVFAEDYNADFDDMDSAESSYQRPEFANRTFSCKAQDARYQSLDSELVATIFPFRGDVSSTTIFKFGLRESCNRVSTTLAIRCSQGPCRVLFCEAQDSRYQTLDSTLYQVINDGPYLRVSAVNQFTRMDECLRSVF